MTDAELAHRFQNKTNENMRKRDKKNASENFIADSKNIQNKVSAGKNKSQKTPLRNVDQKVKTDQFIASANARNKTRAKREEEKWVRQTTTKDGIEVWTRDCRSANASSSEEGEEGEAQNSSIKEIRAKVTYEDVTPEEFWGAVSDLEKYAQYVPYVGKHEVLKRKGSVHSECVYYCYGVITAPVVKNRDYTIKIEAKTLRGQKGYQSKWTLDTDNVGPKEKKGVVRLLANDGGWEVLPSKKNKKKDVTSKGVSVTYSILTDPGSNIPGWLIDKVNRASVPDVLRAMRKRALSGESTHILNKSTQRRNMLFSIGGIGSGPGGGGAFFESISSKIPHFGVLDFGRLFEHPDHLHSIADLCVIATKKIHAKVNEHRNTI
jgi:ribosome-associated toxin RatA of RatAB toxin-antitoxin module